MNEAFDPLEAELSALCPIAPSPELRAGIAKELGGPLPQSSQGYGSGWLFANRFRLITVAACIAAVCLIIAVWRWPAPQPSPEVVRPEPLPLPGNANQSTAWQHGSRESEIPEVSYSWPLEESPPLKAYTSIPADLLE